MAKQTGTLTFTGKLGNVTGYYRKGKHVIRRIPETVQQTVATKRAATGFGTISRKGQLIRQAIVPHLGLTYDGSLVNRLNKALVMAGKPEPGALNQDTAMRPYPLDEANAASRPIDPRPVTAKPILPVTPAPVVHPDDCLRGLQGFSFNGNKGINKLLSQMPAFTAEGVLQIPPQPLRRMGPATHLEVRAIGVGIDFEQQQILEALETKIVADLASLRLPALELPLMAPGKGVLFVVLQLRACIVDRGMVYPLADRRYMAADIVAVIPTAA
ncbi:hypothetical protein F0L74_20495 [Chitinophaga agrisoli]|uniref:Uncharacterized protein n=1 Tax=Chitinophaga agrisoli TaxID=2607653 RepID=A0A5B2VJ95_9BACT|nr:hypothetical protein [Chitinophaga agrisoli]KAA2238606.1 hypothetical protein F0L74_20495 [Chitinophaga agrisoli]